MTFSTAFPQTTDLKNLLYFYFRFIFPKDLKHVSHVRSGLG